MPAQFVEPFLNSFLSCGRHSVTVASCTWSTAGSLFSTITLAGATCHHCPARIHPRAAGSARLARVAHADDAHVRQHVVLPEDFAVVNLLLILPDSGYICKRSRCRASGYSRQRRLGDVLIQVAELVNRWRLVHLVGLAAAVPADRPCRLSQVDLVPRRSRTGPGVDVLRLVRATLRPQALRPDIVAVHRRRDRGAGLDAGAAARPADVAEVSELALTRSRATPFHRRPSACAPCCARSCATCRGASIACSAASTLLLRLLRSVPPLTDAIFQRSPIVSSFSFFHVPGIC